MQSTIPYSRCELWETYNSLYWYNPPQQTDREILAQNIVSCLPNKITPIKVLALGIGTGTLEFFLLSEIQKISGRKVHITGIDWCAQPLKYASKLVANGLENLPITKEDMLSGIKKNWEDSPLPLNSQWDINQEHFFRVDNLDEEVFQPGIPSCWDERLKATSPNKEFDIIISSFCFFHLNFWENTVEKALSLLCENGLLLHPHLEGDEFLFEGKNCKYSLKESPPLRHSNNIAKSIFTDLFFGNPDVREYLSLPRSSSATKPGVISEMLRSLGEYGVKEMKFMDYAGFTLSPIVDKKTYLNMLEERIFSTFRYVEKAIGTSKYDNLLREIDLSVPGNSVDCLRLEMFYSIHKLVDKKKFQSHK
jgi:Methyltransferase domain